MSKSPVICLAFSLATCGTLLVTGCRLPQGPASRPPTLTNSTAQTESTAQTQPTLSESSSAERAAAVQPASFPAVQVASPVITEAFQPIEISQSGSTERVNQLDSDPSDKDLPDDTANSGSAANDRQRLPIEAYVSMALGSNPKLSALRHRVAALSNRIPQARALPDPIIQETFWPFNGNALETAGGRAANQIGLSQKIPWPEKRAAQAAIAMREVQIANAELDEAELEIAEAVSLACVEIWHADEALKTVDEFGDLVQQLNEVTEARYRLAAQSSGQQDVLRAQLEGDRLEDRRVRLVRQKKVAQADLASLLHRPHFAAPEVDIVDNESALEIRLEELIGLAETCNPSFAGLAAQIARDRERQRLACLQRYPDLQLGANWLIVSDNNALSPVATGNDNFGLTVGITLPIWREKIEAGIAEASHQKQSSASLLASEQDSVAGKLRRLVVQFDAYDEQLRILVERIIPRTEDALEIALAAYSGNQADFLSVLDLYEERLLLELQRLGLRRGQHATMFQIEALVGCSSTLQ